MNNFTTFSFEFVEDLQVKKKCYFSWSSPYVPKFSTNIIHFMLIAFDHFNIKNKVTCFTKRARLGLEFQLEYDLKMMYDV